MLQIFVSTFNNVVPLFAVVLVGYALKRFSIVPAELSGPLNSLCFKLLIPCSCVYSMYNTSLDITYLWLTLYMTATFLVSIVLFCIFVPKLVPDPRQAGVVVQGGYRSNSVLFAYALMTNICGADHTGPILVLVALANLLFNSSAVIVLSLFSGKREGRPSFGALCREILLNPIIVGTFIGFLMRFLPFGVPTVILKPISDLGSCAMPMAMLAIGLRLSFRSLQSNRKAIAISTALKLVVMPLVWTAVGFVLGFRLYLLAAIFIEHSCPSSTGGVAMADAMGCDGQLAGEICLTQTVLSCFTIFIGVFLMRLLGLMP